MTCSKQKLEHFAWMNDALEVLEELHWLPKNKNMKIKYNGLLFKYFSTQHSHYYFGSFYVEVHLVEAVGAHSDVEVVVVEHM